MLGHRMMSVEDYTSILRRHVWLIVLPAVVLCAAAYGVSTKLTKKYESRTTVLVQSQRVPSELVKQLEAGDPNERLNSMKEQIMSNSRLQPIVERFGLFNDSGASIDARIAELQKGILVVPVDTFSGRSSALPGFRISVTLSDPHLAQQVCSEITSMFIEQDLKSRESGATNTTTFMSESVEAARARMDAQDAKLAAFKQQYIGVLPDQESMNLNLLMTVNTQIDSVNQALAREESNKGLWEAELATQTANFKASRSQTVAGVASPATLDMELKRKEDELNVLKDKYADNFPTVTEKQRQIDELKKKIATAAAAPPVAPDPKTVPDTTPTNAFVIEPEAIQQLKTRIKGSNLTILEKERELANLQAQAKTYQGRVQSSPQVEQKYSELTRDFGEAQEEYKSLLHKRDDAEMSASLQRRQQGEQFQLVDPASFPEHPTFPNSLQFAGGGFGGGLMLGLALSLLLEFRDKSIRTESDVEALLKLPILAMVPVMDKTSKSRARIVFQSRGETPSLTAKT